MVCHFFPKANSHPEEIGSAAPGESSIVSAREV
jgi:hypothetical protein